MAAQINEPVERRPRARMAQRREPLHHPRPMRHRLEPGGDRVVLRVPEGVCQGLSSNAVNFLSPSRMQIPRLAFNLYAEGGRDRAAFTGGEFFTERLYGGSKIINLGRGRA